ncbi:MAG: hypothetical protein OXC68_11875 [Aestuariivita sp.]|nr:hypothetical protein [Aestuariivita sp.]
MRRDGPKWIRLQTVADAMKHDAHGTHPSEAATNHKLERTLEEAEDLLADTRVATQARLTGLYDAVTATGAHLTRQRDVKDRVRDLRTRWKAVEADATQQGCHPMHVAGYQRVMEQLIDFTRERPADLPVDLPVDLAAAVDRHAVWEKQATDLQQDVKTVMTCDARRRAIITSAAKWTPETPLNRSRLTRYGRWARSAPKVIEDGQRLARNPLLSPEDRTTLETALERITAALDGCGLEAKHLGRFETILDQAAAQGCHRFFVEDYDRFIIGLGTRTIVAPGRNTLAVRERAVQDAMRLDAVTVQGLERDLEKTMQERETGGEAFVATMHPYQAWHQDATRTLTRVRRVLGDRARYGPHLDRVPGLETRLRKTAAAVAARITQDAPLRTAVTAAHERETAQQIAQIRARERARSRSRSRSRGLGLGL